MHEPGTLNPSYFDGIIVLSQKNEDMEFMDEVLSKKIPMTVICRSVDIDAPNVTTDEARAMERAMDYLLDNGHRKLAVIEGRPELDSTRLRHRGWRISMRKHGLDPDQVPMINGNYRYGSGYSAAKQLLSYEPTAILCFNDEMAFGARTAIDGERNMGDIAREGARVLLRRLDDGIVDNRRIYLDNKLIIRDTVRNLKEE